jgi:hypothetical protein
VHLRTQGLRTGLLVGALVVASAMYAAGDVRYAA